MPTRNVNLTPELNAFVDGQLKTGRYQNASEVVRAGLRALELEQDHYEEKTARTPRRHPARIRQRNRRWRRLRPSLREELGLRPDEKISAEKPTRGTIWVHPKARLRLHDFGNSAE